MDSGKTGRNAALDALAGMSELDLRKMLETDPLYRSVLAHAPERDRAKIEAVALDFVMNWKSNAFDRIVEMASNPEFVKALMKMFEERSGEGGHGGVI